MTTPLTTTTTTAAAVTASTKVQTLIIGAGVLGLACARELAQRGHEVIILERSSHIGSGTSSRNSEVLHAGLYYHPQKSSLKAQLCVRGRRLMYDYCSSRGVDYNKCGKLIVAASELQHRRDLHDILQRGVANGVEELKLLDREDIRCMEPEVQCHGALWSPSTGVVDSHGLMLAMLGEAEGCGAMLALNCAVTGLSLCSSMRNNNNNAGNNNMIHVETEDMDLYCENVVNAAGLFSAQLAASFSFAKTTQFSQSPDVIKSKDHPQEQHQLMCNRQYFAKGNYFRLEGQRTPFSHLIYPVPEPGGLGVHATLDLNGYCRFGPDVQWISADCVDPDEIDLDVDPDRGDLFYEQVRRYWPGLQDGCLAPDYAGVRPKIDHPDVSVGGLCGFADFVVQGPKDHGVAGVVHLIGMESPGLTSSLAVAELVADTLSA